MIPFVLPAGRDSNGRAVRFVSELALGQAWRVTVEPYKPRRSDAQNRYLFGVVYKTIGDSLGYSGRDELELLHKQLKGDYFGWTEVDILGVKQQVPAKGSSKLNKQEFSDYVAWIQRRMAEHGIYIPEPGEICHG